MTVTPSKAELTKQWGHLSTTQKTWLVKTLDNDNDPIFNAPIMAAIMSRETNIANIDGDGGHGRGVVQIDDRSHAEFLRGAAGCKSGTWKFVHGHKAIEAGYVPGLSAGVTYGHGLLVDNYHLLRSRGYSITHSRQGAIAGYNCGMGNVLTAINQHGIEGVDHFTAGGDYSKDVLKRAETFRSLVAQFKKTHPHI